MIVDDKKTTHSLYVQNDYFHKLGKKASNNEMSDSEYQKYSKELNDYISTLDNTIGINPDDAGSIFFLPGGNASTTFHTNDFIGKVDVKFDLTTDQEFCGPILNIYSCQGTYSANKTQVQQVKDKILQLAEKNPIILNTDEYKQSIEFFDRFLTDSDGAINMNWKVDKTINPHAEKKAEKNKFDLLELLLTRDKIKSDTENNIQSQSTMEKISKKDDKQNPLEIDKQLKEKLLQENKNNNTHLNNNNNTNTIFI